MTERPLDEIAEQIIQQADNGQFPSASLVLGKLQSGDFELDGMQFHFKQQKTALGHQLSCSTLVGYMPYTAEAREKRVALHQILQASSRLRRARFKLDNSNHIQLEGTIPLPAAPEDADVMLGLLQFYQEARPMLQLVATQL